MATLSATGIGSGLDVETIITKLMAVEKRPIEQLTDANTKLQTQLSAYGTVQSYLSTFRDAAAKMNDPATWSAATATSSDATAVSATSSGAAGVGNYAVKVTALASSQSVNSGVYASSSALVGEGTMRITPGTWSADVTVFNQNASPAIDITVGAFDTLNTVRDKINASGSGVYASIVNDAAGARLVMRSTATGAQNGFKVTAADGAGNPADPAGLGRLAYDPSTGASGMTRTQAASNAQAEVNGLSVDSPSNTLTGVIEGVTVKLSKVTSAPVDINVAQDGDSMRKQAESFITAYNSLANLLIQQTKYDAGSKKGATLQGDRTAVSMQAQLRGMLTNTGGTSSTFKRLSDVGMEVQTDGTLKLSTSKFNASLAKIDDVKKLFSGTDANDSSRTGITQRLRTLADQLLGSEGPLSTRQAGIKKSMTVNDKRKDELADRTASTEKRLRAQYSLLDTKLTQSNNLSSYMSQQLSMLNNLSNS